MNQAGYYPTRRWILLPLAIFAALFVAGVSLWFFAFHAAPPAYMWYPWYGWYPFGWFFVIPVFILVFFVFRAFFWGSWRKGGYWSDDDSALEILRVRFAKGEITKEQYEQMKKDLTEERQ